MPLTKRIIEPVNISRVHVPAQGLRNELECVTNHTLANVIRQLSSLSRMAEDMFYELTEETKKVFLRANQLQGRIENVQDKVTQLNATVEEVNLQDIHLKKPYKSSVTKEQQVISRSTVPRSILEIYSKCDSPPALDKLNVFREDGKDSMKFYTDPTYFVELWVQEMDKQIQENKTELNKKRERRRVEATYAFGNEKAREIKDSKAKWRAQKDGVEFSEYQVGNIHERVRDQQNLKDPPRGMVQHPQQVRHPDPQQQQQHTGDPTPSVSAMPTMHPTPTPTSTHPSNIHSSSNNTTNSNYNSSNRRLTGVSSHRQRTVPPSLRATPATQNESRGR